MACVSNLAPVGVMDGCKTCHQDEKHMDYLRALEYQTNWGRPSAQQRSPDGSERVNRIGWSPERRSRTRKRHDAISGSMERLAREQAWFKCFMERMEALEQRSKEMILKDEHEKEQKNAEEAITDAENTFTTHSTKLSEGSEDNDRIDRHLKALDSMEEQIADIISLQGWESETKPSNPYLSGPCIREISAVDLSDEISEVSFGSRCQTITVGLAHPTESKLVLPTTPDTKRGGSSLVPTIETAEQSEPSSFYYDDDESNGDNAQLLDQDATDFGMTGMFHKARFMHHHERDLLVSPSPFTSPPVVDGSSDDVFCWPNKSCNKSDECQACVIQ